jgi:hypothetical protein
MSEIVHLKHGTVEFEDASGTPITITLGPGNGDMTISGLEEGGYAADKVYDRMDFLQYVRGQEKTLTGSINVFQDGEVTHASVKKPLDAVLKTGTFGSGVTDDAGGTVWTGTLRWSASRGAVTASIELPNTRLIADFSESHPANGLAISWECPKGASVVVA